MGVPIPSPGRVCYTTILPCRFPGSQEGGQRKVQPVAPLPWGCPVYTLPGALRGSAGSPGGGQGQQHPLRAGVP